jgi:tRNA A-37 threonylcarbamoyl transferase component Bud32/tetratricopeptide (TPR) repeat protein
VTQPPTGRVAQLFDAALALHGEQRAAFVDAETGDDAVLRAELHSLLAAYDASEGFFETLARRVVAPDLAMMPGTQQRTAGDRVAQYEIIEEIGVGGMGVVYRARDTRLARDVALKFLPAHMTRDAAAAAQLLREARAASALDHPNIATVYEIGEAGDGGTFLAMAWCPGETLRTILERGPLPVDEALAIARHVADALVAAHAAGIVHRDVKPANIVIAPDGVVKLVDFGIARVAGEEMTRAGGTLGTVAYMSPEQTRGSAPDAGTDVWSLGVVLYEMLAGRRPFRGADEAVIIHGIRHDEPEPLTQLRPAVPEPLVALVARCLSRDPATRGDAAAIAAELSLMEMGVFGSARRRPWHSPLRGRRAAVMAAAAVLALGAGGYWAALRPVAPELDARRVLVIPLENRTGDAGLEPIGSMAADWLIQGLAQTGTVDVVPVTTSLAAARFVRQETAAADPARALRALAAETRAATVISGAYYHQGDSLYLGLAITDIATGRVLHALQPVATARNRPTDGIELLRQELMRSAAQHLNPRLQQHAGYMRTPPSFDAYRAFADGLERFVAGDWRGSIERMVTAAAADTSFVVPLLYAGIAHANTGNYATTDSILEHLKPQRPSFPPFEGLAFDMLVAQTAGDPVAYYRAHLDAPRIAPNALAHYGLALGAMLINRPAEALTVFRDLDPERGELRGWVAYWSERSRAEHLLGRHRDELRTARRARSLHTVHPAVAALEANALAGLGRRRALASMLQRERERHPAPHTLLLSTGLELLAHGDSAGAVALLRESLELARQLPLESLANRWFVVRASYLVGDYDHASALLLPLIREHPEMMALRGMAGAIAARTGDLTAARAADEWLETLDRPYMHGFNTYLRARIAALLGHRDDAVHLLRQSWREGYRAHSAGHADPDLRPLHRHAPYRAFMRPAG